MGRSLGGAIRRLLLAVGLAAVMPALAQGNAAAIKSAFIYNFAKFVEWPETAFATPQSPLQLCSWGPVLEGQLQQLEGREAQGHEITVRILNSPDELSGCHILVLGNVDDSLRRRLLPPLHESAVLTISDTPASDRDGSIITLFVQANRVQFSVNLNAAQNAGLRMSARMLQLAHSVQGGQS